MYFNRAYQFNQSVSQVIWTDLSPFTFLWLQGNELLISANLTCSHRLSSEVNFWSFHSVLFSFLYLIYLSFVSLCHQEQVLKFARCPWAARNSSYSCYSPLTLSKPLTLPLTNYHMNTMLTQNSSIRITW